MLFIFRNFVSIVVSLLQEASRGVSKGLAKPFRRRVLLAGVFLAALVVAVVSIALANNTAQAPTFKQDWTNTGLITANNNWGSVPGIIGYNGIGLALSAGTDPQTILLDGSLTPVTVLANQTNTGLNTGGVAEFQLANPTVALQGDNTASAPHIVLNLDTTGRSNIHVGYNLRDIDGSTDNAAQQVALQYRVGSVGNYTNIPAGYVADATTGPSQATQVTPVSVTLPAAADNQSLVQLRVITSKVTTNQKDEWVGVDDIVVTSTPTASSQSVATNAAKTITLSGTDADGDNLTFSVPSGPTNGTLGAIGTPTCSGTAPKTCQANVTYTPNAGFNGSDSFNFRVNDGTVNSANATVSITVDTIAPSAPSITSPANNSYDNDGAFTVSGTAEANSSVELFEGAQSKGTTTASGSGSWSVNLSSVSEGDHTYTAKATDAAGNESGSSSSVTVKVDKTNPNTTITDGPSGTISDTTLSFKFSSNEAGSTFECRLTKQGDSPGTFASCHSNDSFGPLTDGEYTFEVRAVDLAGNTGSAASRTFTVDTNDAPTAGAQSVSTDEDTPKTITLSGSDPDGDNLTFEVTDDPTKGTLGSIGPASCTGTAPKTCQAQVTYAPDSNYNGPDSFKFRVSDGAVNSTKATVSVNVEPVNDSPVAANDTATTDEDTAVVINVTNNDAPGPANKSGQSLTVTSVTDPAKGTAEIITTGANAGKVRYTPDDNYNGTDSFGYTVCDNGTPSKCATATVNVNVTAVDDAPVAKNDSYNAKQKKTLKTKAPGVLQNDEDVDSANLSVQVVQGPTKGTLTLKNDGSFTYKPKGGFKGQDSFTYKVSDGAKESNTATVTITVK